MCSRYTASGAPSRHCRGRSRACARSPLARQSPPLSDRHGERGIEWPLGGIARFGGVRDWRLGPAWPCGPFGERREHAQRVGSSRQADCCFCSCFFFFACKYVVRSHRRSRRYLDPRVLLRSSGEAPRFLKKKKKINVHPRPAYVHVCTPCVTIACDVPECTTTLSCLFAKRCPYRPFCKFFRPSGQQSSYLAQTMYV